MKRPSVIFAAAAGLLCLAGAPARAGLIPAPGATWTYSFTSSVPSIAADQLGPSSPKGNVTLTAQSSPVDAMNNPQPSTTGINGHDVNGIGLTSATSATSDNPATISGSNGHYTITMKLTDFASGNSATFAFSGKMSGTFSKTDSNINNTWLSGPGGTPGSAPVFQADLGAYHYVVSVTKFAGPDDPSAINPGVIQVHVQTFTLNVAQVPEPSAAVLSCLGVFGVGFASWRKRRRTLASLLA
jgi:hypothetical protein